MRAFVVTLAVLGFAAAASAERVWATRTVTPEADTAEIVGGTLAPAGKWPDSVAVLGNQGSCTGTLIAPDVVLTAGHCVGGLTQVKANTIDYAAAGGQTATIKSHTAYPNWQGTLDISVIVLNTPITGVTPRALGMDCTFTLTSFNTMKPSVQLVGFGVTDAAGTQNNTRQYEVTVPVTDPTCTTTAGVGCRAAPIAPSGEFIAGGNNRDSCYGDSGGPVYLDTPRGTMVIGAVSRGFENATTPCGGGGIYIRTGDAVAQWIEQTAGKTVSKDSCAGAPTNPTNPDPTNPTNPDGSNEPSNDVTGGCTSSRGTGLGALLLLGLALLGRRRR